MTPYILSAIFALCASFLIFAAYKICLKPNGKIPSEDKAYWKKMTTTFRKGFITGAIGCGGSVLTILIEQAIIAEICCITTLSAIIFPLALLSRKTNFEPCTETLRLQKRWQKILLSGAFGVLFLTQFVFIYFNSLISA